MVTFTDIPIDKECRRYESYYDSFKFILRMRVHLRVCAGKLVETRVLTPLTKLGELGVFLQIILLSKRFELQMPDWTQMKEN